MVDRSFGKGKVEKFGLSEEALRLKGKGWGSVRIANALSSISKESINSTNVENYFKSLGNRAQDYKVLKDQISTAIKGQELTVLNQWNKIDDKLAMVLTEAESIQEQIKGYKNPDLKSLQVIQTNLRLIKDVVSDAAKISETRARVLGQISSGGQKIYITKVENQYNDLKQIIMGAEETYPGIGKWIVERMTNKTRETTKE